MKLSIHTIISLFLIFSVTFFSCRDNNANSALLKQAQDIADTKPLDAIRLLDSINQPENMDKEHYMQYVLTRTKVILKIDKETPIDPIILDAQKYFTAQKNTKNSALSHFYVAAMNFQKGRFDDAFEHYLQAEHDARNNNDNILTAKSLNNLGYLYFEQNMMDSAINKFAESLSFYNKEKGTESYKMNVLNLTGRAYEHINNMDSASLYFNQALELAEQSEDKPFQAAITQNLGHISLNLKNYDKATKYFHQALQLTPKPEDLLKIYLNSSNLYTLKAEPDSAKHYMNLAKIHLSKTTKNNTLRLMYGVFSYYYKREKNYEEALYYSELQKEINQKIIESDSSQRLLEMGNKYKFSLKEKELSNLQTRLYLYISIGLSLIILVALIAYFTYRNIRHKQQQAEERNKLLETKNELLDQKIENLQFLQNIYQNISNEWTDIEKEVKSLAVEYGAKEKPSIYLKIEGMIKDLKDKTNIEFIEKSKDYLRKEYFGDKAIESLNNKDLIILILCYWGYTTKEIAPILGVVPSKQNFYLSKLSIRNKLAKTGLSESQMNQINQVLFNENENVVEEKALA